MSDTSPNPAELSPDTLEPASAVVPLCPSDAEAVAPQASPEEKVPMLDVHPPHEAVHTWKDFFIHIATIVIGLLIAIGLEQTVEYVHHRTLAKEAREKLAEEIAINRNLVAENMYALRMHQDYLFADLPVIGRMRAHAVAPGDRIVVWHPYNLMAESSWVALHESDAASLLHADELLRYARVYRTQGMFNDLEVESAVSLLRAQSAFYRSAADRFVYKQAGRVTDGKPGFGQEGDAAARAAFEDQAPDADKLNRLTPAQLDRLEQAIQQAIYDDDRLINFCVSLQTRYDEFAKDEK